MNKFNLIGISTFTSKKTGNPCHVAHISVPCSFDNFEGDQVLTAFIGDDEYAALTGHTGESFNAYRIQFGKDGKPNVLIGVLDGDGE